MEARQDCNSDTSWHPAHPGCFGNADGYVRSAVTLEDAEPVISCIELDWPGCGRTLLMKVGKTLDICDHGAFRRAYELCSADIHNYIVDFSDTRWIDPSVLGMLLLLRKHSGGDRRRIHVAGAGYRIRDALAGANIHALFSTDTLLPSTAAAWSAMLSE